MVMPGFVGDLIGLLCLRAPLQTPELLGLLMGIMWVTGGAIRVGQGVLSTGGAPRGWRIVPLGADVPLAFLLNQTF